LRASNRSAKKWHDRDSESAQANIGRVWQLLKCGCEFKVVVKDTDTKDSRAVTDGETIWLLFWVHNFSWFENSPHEEGENEHDGYERDSSGEWLHFYIPTISKIFKANGGDWC